MLPVGHLQNRVIVNAKVEEKILGYPTAQRHKVRGSRKIRGSHEIMYEKSAPMPRPHPATEVHQSETICSA